MAQRVLDQILVDHVVKLSGTDNDNTKDKLVGAAFIVVSKDEVIYRGGAGYGYLSEDKTPPKFSTKSFTWVASLTKIFTVTCLMQLVERGLITLDQDDLRTIVPELRHMQILEGFQESNASQSNGSDSSCEHPILVDNAKPITLRHLLTHTVGLGYDIADPDLRRWAKATGRSITNLSFTLDGWNTPLKFPPGEGWYYGSAIDWAGQVLERITGRTLGEYMAEHIFEPLGIYETTFRPGKFLDGGSELSNRAVSCSSRDPDTGTVSMIPLPVPTDPPVDSGGGGLWTTAEDYAKLLQNLVKSRLGHDKGLLSKESIDEVFRPQLNEVQHSMFKSLTDMFHDGMVPEFPPGTPINHGLGGVINMEDVSRKRRKGSMMWEGMANSHWWIDAETGIAAALIVNIISDADPVVRSLYNGLELAVYADLVPEWLAKGAT